MRTPELSDDELDDLFRQGAEGYPEEVNLGAWLRMEQQLDEAEMQRRVNRKVARLFAAEMAAAVVLLLIWLGYRQYSPDATAIKAVATSGTTAAVSTAPKAAAAKNATPEEGTRQVVGQPSVAVPAAGVAPTSSAASASVEAAGQTASLAVAPSEPLATHSSAALPRNTLAPAASLGAVRASGRKARKPVRLAGTPSEAYATYSASAAGVQRSKRTGMTRTAASHENFTAIVQGRVSTRAAQPAAPNVATSAGLAGPAALGAAAARLGASSGISSASSANLPSASASSLSLLSASAQSVYFEPLIALTPELAGLGNFPLPTPSPVPVAAVAKADSVPAPKRRRIAPEHRLVVGLLYSPDFSTVRFASVESPGRNFGLQLEYRFSDRLRLSTGLLNAHKLYRAKWEDYTVPSAYPVQPGYSVSYDWVNGTCTVLDIPLNLRYDWLVQAKSRAFASAGLSSFLMRREHYDYEYYLTNNATGYSHNYYWDKRITNGKQHWLSVVNLSAGYEQQLGSHWSLQAEPYVKVPLGGVGYGKIKLLSGGVFLGLKYGL